MIAIKQFHVYTLFLTTFENVIPVYVGKGSNEPSRYKTHLREGRIIFDHYDCEWFDNVDVALNHEKTLIQQYGRVDLDTGTLLNRTNGGERGGSDGCPIIAICAASKFVKFDAQTEGMFNSIREAARVLFNGNDTARRLINNRILDGGGVYKGTYFEKLETAREKLT